MLCTHRRQDVKYKIKKTLNKEHSLRCLVAQSMRFSEHAISFLLELIQIDNANIINSPLTIQYFEIRERELAANCERYRA